MPERRDKPAFADDLDETLAHSWRQLARGVKDRRSPFHTPSVATIGLDGRPRLRTVVLRGVEPATARLRFHTDARADKVAELAADPRIALHAYDPQGKFQIRIEGRAIVHRDDALAEQAWRASRMTSRACYATEPAPGSAIGEGGAFRLPADEGEILAGRAHFCAVEVVAQTLETLYLAHDGHRRARFGLQENGTSAGRHEACWLVP
ncbi:pyridoxamine 5'-phosphate oxidase family protein [Salinarimonas sp.]|uniref:pyridoxamine 5'-phosphate oxidase family protein n=1 Tax=Salinarimonas sp. TaxID=2766526 RepID=UPI0032D8D05A